MYDLRNRQVSPENTPRTYGKVAFKAMNKCDEEYDGHNGEYYTIIKYYNKEYNVLIKGLPIINDKRISLIN
jgi:hypothetical protein